MGTSNKLARVGGLEVGDRIRFVDTKFTRRGFGTISAVKIVSSKFANYDEIEIDTDDGGIIVQVSYVPEKSSFFRIGGGEIEITRLEE